MPTHSRLPYLRGMQSFALRKGKLRRTRGGSHRNGWNNGGDYWSKSADDGSRETIGSSLGVLSSMHTPVASDNRNPPSKVASESLMPSYFSACWLSVIF